MPRDSRSAAFIAQTEGSETFYLWSNRDTLVKRKDTRAAACPHGSYRERNPFPAAFFPFPEPGRLKLLLAVTQGAAQIFTRPSITKAGGEVRGGAAPVVFFSGEPRQLGALTLIPRLCESTLHSLAQVLS